MYSRPPPSSFYETFGFSMMSPYSDTKPYPLDAPIASPQHNKIVCEQSLAGAGSFLMPEEPRAESSTNRSTEAHDGQDVRQKSIFATTQEWLWNTVGRLPLDRLLMLVVALIFAYATLPRMESRGVSAPESAEALFPEEQGILSGFTWWSE